MESVNKSGNHGFTFDYSYDANGHPDNIYCRSDHAMYARFGIPIVFFTTGGHSDYHMLSDEPQRIDYTKMSHVGSLVYDIALHVADGATTLDVESRSRIRRRRKQCDECREWRNG